MYNIVFWPMQPCARSVRPIHATRKACTERAQGCMEKNTMVYMFLFWKFYFRICKPTLWRRKIFFLQRSSQVFKRVGIKNQKNISKIKTCLVLYFGPWNTVHVIHASFTACRERAQGCMGQNIMLNMFFFLYIFSVFLSLLM